MNPTLLPALPAARTALARTGARELDGGASELIVVGHFALRQKIVPASHAAHVQPTHARLPPSEPTREVAPHFSPQHNVPSPLPTEAWLALRTATAGHRKAAYASFS